MKTAGIFKTGLALLIVAGFSMNASASNDPTSTTVRTMEESAVGAMQISVPSDMETYVSVLDQDGDMIYSDMVARDDNAGKMYDFSEMENGIYTFKTITQHKVVETTFEVEMNEMNILREDISYRPVFWINDDMLTISFMNLDQGEVYLTLEDELPVNDEVTVLYEEKAESDMSYERIFNIKNLSKGEYTLTLTTGGQTYNYLFDK
ncbi:MAG: hypothetical protein V2I47_07010 [Bacteroidales bacterium]|jgi:hypothetical protein|nr:hypothetical protein [Bacteroidales bacterium]